MKQSVGIVLLSMLAATPAAGAEPMLDGRCDDHRTRDAQRLEIDNGVSVFWRQTRDHVWLCVALPPESYGTIDLRVDSPALARPLNLHASAQLGQWAADDAAAAPKDAASPIWGKAEGWWANVVPFGGMTDTPQGRRPSFRTIRGRELQLAKARFGRGVWKLSATIADVKKPGGDPVTVRWPKAGAIAYRVR